MVFGLILGGMEPLQFRNIYIDRTCDTLLPGSAHSGTHSRTNTASLYKKKKIEWLSWLNNI